MADPEGFRIASAWIEVEPNADDFQEKLQAALDEAVAGVRADVSVGLDKSGVDAGADDVRAKVAELDDLRAEIEIAANDDDLRAKADDAKAKRDELDGSVAEIEIAGNTDDWDAKSDEARAERDELDGTSATITIKGDDAAFQAMAARDKAEASGGGGESDSLIGALSLGVGSLMPGIGGAAAGMGLLAGTGALAFGGIAKALEAHSQAAGTAGTTGAQLASTAFSNAVAVQQAQQGVQQAYEQSAEAASASAAQVESAQTSEAEAVRSAAQSQAQALQAVTQAQQQEQQATFGLGQAQYSLTAAWIQARYSLEQLNDSERDSATTIKAARLAVEQAQYQQRLTDQNAMSTSLDRQQAAIAVTQAQEALTAAQQQATYTSREASLQDKAGVAGSQTVLSAKEAVRQAVEAVRSAEVQAADAQRNLTDTELDNAAQIKQAQLGVSQAERQAAYSQQQSAQSVRTALRNVTDTMKEQRLAAAATASTSNKAASQYTADLAKMSPAGRAFVGQLLGMRGALHSLEGDAQSAVLPGVSRFFKGLKGDLPIVSHGVKEMGHSISDAFGGFGKLMDTKGFQSGLSGLLANGVQFADIVLPAFGQFIEQLGEVGGKKGAVTGLADGLAGIGHGLAGLVSGLAPYIPQIDKVFAVVGKFLAQMGPALAQTIGTVARVISPLMSFLNSKAGAPVVRTLAQIAAGMLVFKGMRKIISGPLESGIGAARKLGSVVRGLPGTVDKLSDRIASLGGGAGKVFSGIRGWGSKLGTSLRGTFDVIRLRGMYAWEGISGAAGKAWGGISGFGSKVGSMMSTAASSVATFASGVGTRLAAAASATGAWIAENATAAASYIAENVAMAASATAAFIAENAATLGIGAAVALLVTGIVLLATHWHQVWGAIKDVAEDAWSFLTKGWGKYLFPEIDMIRDAVSFLGDHWSQIWGTIQSVSEAVWQDGLQPVFKGIEDAAEFLYNDAIHPYFQLMIGEFDLVKDAALFMWHDVFDPLWQGIETGARDFVSGFSIVWGTLESVFRKPVNFLIKTVYDNGIRRLWDDVVEHIGLGSLKLPVIPAMAAGGIVPGHDRGYDSQIVAMRPGEGVLQPGAVAAIGPGTVHHLNAQYGDKPAGGGMGGSLAKSAAKLPLKEAVKRTVERPAEHLLGFAHGGVLGMIDRGISDLGKGILDGARYAELLATDPGKAVTDILGHVVGTNATGQIGRVMEAIPRALVGDLAKAIGMHDPTTGGNMSTGTAGGLSGTALGRAIVARGESYMGKVPYVYGGTSLTQGVDCSGFTDDIYRLYGFNPPRTSEQQWDWVQRTKEPVLGGLAFFAGSPIDPPPGHVGIVTGRDQMVDAYGTGYGVRLNSIYGSSGAVYGFGVPPGGGGGLAGPKGTTFDSGGWLMPDMPLNQTGSPEAVLTPQESQAFVALVRQMLAHQNGGGAGRQVIVNQNYLGPMMPNPEMQAQQRRELALLLGSG